MASKQKKWFKSAFDDTPNWAKEEAQKPKSVFRSLSEYDSIDLTDLDSIAFLDETNQNNNSKNSSKTLNKSIDESFAPVRMVITNFKSSNWIENFAPQTKTDLVIHAKKLGEVEDWFNSVKAKRVKCAAPILLVTGPSGSAKTAAIKVMAKEFNYEISEWITPIDIEHVRGDRVDGEQITYSESQNDKFSQFLFQSSRYRSVFDTSSKRLVLVEDFPNTYLKDPAAFETVLERYSVYGKSPLIFIVTDTKSRTLNIGFTLFTDAVRERFNMTTISFNAVADTLLKKGLKRICSIMNQPGFQTYYTEPNKDMIDSIVLSSQGDIRSAVINLHFASQKNAYKLLTESHNNNNNNIPTSRGKKSKAAKKSKLKSLGCDENITTLHALGRVFNPKYNEALDANGHKQFLHPPDDITGTLSTQPQTNIGLIHHNYVSHFTDLDDIVQAAETLSASDVLINEWRSDTLAEIALNTAVRGVMIANNKPVTGRWMPVRSAKNNNQPKIDLEKECKKLGIPLLLSSNVLACDYRSYAKLIPVKPLLNDSKITE